MYPVANRELLISGIIFHDIMKAKEYTYNHGIAGDFTADGVLFGHIFLGAELPNAMSVKKKQSQKKSKCYSILSCLTTELRSGAVQSNQRLLKQLLSIM